MGMFDWYDPDLPCPKCGGVTLNFQGKDGPNALFRFRQGYPEQTTHDVDEECRLEDCSGHGERGLPDEFVFGYGECSSCGGHGGFWAVGYLEDGVWNRSEYLTNGHRALRIDDELVLCDECESLINVKRGMPVALCTKCHNLVAIYEQE